jgi:hypothetical protein
MKSVNASATKISAQIAPPNMMYGPAMDIMIQGQQVVLRILLYCERHHSVSYIRIVVWAADLVISEELTQP